MKCPIKSDPFRRVLFSLLGVGMVLSPSPAHSADSGDRSAISSGIISSGLEIVSLDYCADQYVLALADRDQILALSQDADKSHSFHKERALGLPKFHSTMAEVITLQPDVAVQSWRVTTRIKDMIARIGTKLVIPKYGSDPEIVIENVRLAGQFFGQEKRAAALIDGYRTRLSHLRSASKSPLRAAYVTPSGFTAGTGTFVDEIIQLAGFSSYAASRNLVSWQALPMEDLLIDPPDLFIASFFDTSLATQSGWSIARHDRLYRMLRDIPTIYLPGRYLSCNGLFLVDAAERIRSDALKQNILSQNSSPKMVQKNDE